MQVPGKMLTCVGRCHYGDLGEMATGVRLGEESVASNRCLHNHGFLLVVALVPYDFLTGVFSYFAPLMGDYKKYNKVRESLDLKSVVSHTFLIYMQDRGVEE